MNTPITQTLEDRLRQLIDLEAPGMNNDTPGTRKWKDLEKASGIGSSSWVDFHRGKKRATAEMIEAIATVWPEYAFWLVTGISDGDFGHAAPRDQGFPERAPRKSNTADLFKKKMAFKAEAIDMYRQMLDIDEIDFVSAVADSDLIISDLLRTEGYAQIDTEKYRDLQSKCAIANRLRRAEIMLETELPLMDYEETERALHIVRNLITHAPEADKVKLNELLRIEQERVDRHNAYIKQHGPLPSLRDLAGLTKKRRGTD